MKSALKNIARGIATLLMLIPACASGFGRITAVFTFFGQSICLFPGLPGNYLRTAYYVLTLRRCRFSSRVSFGSFIGKSQSTLGENVYIGSWCVLGLCEIGDRTQIADHVQIPSGRRQHARDSEGRIGTSQAHSFEAISIGRDCWIGAGAIVMNDVGAGCTVGAGSIVTRAVEAGTVVAGNPARPIRSGSQSPE